MLQSFIVVNLSIIIADHFLLAGRHYLNGHVRLFNITVYTNSYFSLPNH